MLPDLNEILYFVAGIVCCGMINQWLTKPAVKFDAGKNASSSEVKVPESEPAVQSEEEIPDSDLLLATKAGDLKKMKALIDSDPSIVLKEQAICSFTAIEENQLAALQLLLENGASPNCATIPDHLTLLMDAAREKRDAMVTLLLKHGAKDSVQTVKELLDAGSNPSHKNKDGHTALYFSNKGNSIMQSLITTYQQGGPSWLARELSAQGLSWSVVCAVEAKLVREGFVSQSAMANTPLTAFSSTALKSIGIKGVAIQQMVLNIRLRSTWLGARLSTMSVDYTNMTACENSIFHLYNCTTKEQFAALLPSDLQKVPKITARNVTEILLETHRQVRKELRVNTITDSTVLIPCTTTTSIDVINERGSVVSSASDVSTPCAEMEDGVQVVDVGAIVGSADSSGVSGSDDYSNNIRVSVTSDNGVDSVGSWEQL